MTPSRPRRSVWPLAALPAAGVLALIAAASGIAEDRPSPSDTPPQTVAETAQRPAEGPASPDAGPRDAVAGPGKVTPHRHPSGTSGAKTVPDDDRQICYQVRFINGDLESLRKLLNRFKLLKQEADVAAWTLDDASLRDLLTQIQGDAGMSIIRAPKVTSFHRAHAIVTNCEKQRYVAGYHAVEDPALPFRPIVKELDLGSKVDIAGQIMGQRVADGTRVSLDVSDSRLLGFRTEMCEQRIGPEVVAADYHVPDMLDRRCQVTCDVPDGSHVLISLGRSPLPRKPTAGASGLVNGLFAAMGLPQPIGFVPIERLVLITPRRILLESEEVSGPLPSGHPEGNSRPL